MTELPKSSGKRSGKTEDQVLKLLSDRPEMTIPELAKALGITTRGRELGMTAKVVVERLGTGKPTASIAVARGEAIAKERRLRLP